jgi:hypothetical protein
MHLPDDLRLENLPVFSAPKAHIIFFFGKTFRLKRHRDPQAV